MRRIISLLVVGTLVVAGGLSFAAQAQQDLLPLRLTPGLVSILRMINWVALNEGIYKKNGLDVDQCMPAGDVKDIKEATGIEVPMEYRCKPGGAQSPIGLSGGQPAFLGHFQTSNPNPRKRVILATLQNRTNYQIFARKDIIYPEQLKGKRLAITSHFNIMGFQALLFIRTMGWEPGKDITLVIDPSGMNDGLAKGEFDAYLAGEGLPLWQATQQGYKPVVDFRGWKIPMASSSIHVEEAWLKNNRETARRFVKAMVETISVVKQNKQTFYRALAKYYGMKDPKMQEFFYNTWDFPAKPYPSVDGLREAKVLYDNYPGVKAQEFRNAKIEDYIDNSFIRELDQSGWIDSLYRKK